MILKSKLGDLEIVVWNAYVQRVVAIPFASLGIIILYYAFEPKRLLKVYWFLVGSFIFQ